MSPPLLGRARELAELSRLRGAALAGGGSILLLAGEAGIGKTAVLRAFAGTASGAGTPVLAGRCVADEGAPAFWPLRRVLDAAGGLPPALLDVAPALRDLGPELLDMTDAPPAVARFLAIERTVRALLAAAGPARLVVTLDDLQSADEATVRLLHYLHGELPGSRLLVVGAAREVTPALAELHAPVLRLVPLTEPDVAAYLSAAGSAVGSAVGSVVDPSWPAYVHRRTGGNPLFLRELTRVLVQEDRLGAPVTPLSIPTELRRMVGYRTDRLDPACRRLLGGASAIGEEFDVALLASADGGDPGAVSDLLAEAIDAGVLVDEPDTPDRLRFAHGLARQARYDELSRAERVEWHRRIAAALQAGNSGARRRRLGCRHLESRHLESRPLESRRLECRHLESRDRGPRLRLPGTWSGRPSTSPAGAPRWRRAGPPRPRRPARSTSPTPRTGTGGRSTCWTAPGTATPSVPGCCWTRPTRRTAPARCRWRWRTARPWSTSPSGSAGRISPHAPLSWSAVSTTCPPRM